MPTFPSYAKILIAGYGEQRESALLRTDMETGPAKQAKIKSRVPVVRPVTILLRSLDDYNAFKDWFATDLSEGALWFDFFDQVSKTTKSGRIVGGGLDAAAAGSTLEIWKIPVKLETWG